MDLKSVLLLVIVTLVDVKCYKIWGKFTNISAIMQRIMDIGDRKISNPDPDLTIVRKNFRNSIILVVKRNYTDHNDVRKYLRKSSKKKKLTKEEETAKLVKEQHDRKVKDIVKFMEDHYLTTNYLYDEVQRIKKDRQVKDDLRLMVENIESSNNAKLKESVLKCYNKKKKKYVPVKDMYRHKTNNLVLNVLGDPYNDGFIN